MFNISESNDSIEFKMSSEMKLVDRVVNETREFLGQDAEGCFSELKLVMRELLINAVEHGNRKEPTRCVKCEVKRCNGSLYKVQVDDEGDGFDWRKANLSAPDDPSKPRSRGFPLVNALADSLEFNEKGNGVSALVAFHRKTGYAVSDDGGWCVITPSGDITASSSDSLRELLSQLLNSGMGKCRIDFSHVRDIDSVGLSVLIVLSRIMAEMRGAPPQLEISNAPEDIRRLFQMTMLDSIYRLLPS